jgi:signal peptide peptidase SppA
MRSTKPRTRLEHVLEQPWALYPQTLTRIVAWAREDQANKLDPTELVAQNGTHDGAVRAGSVAIIPVYGVIEQHSDWFMEMFGGVSVDGLRESLRAALADPDVKAVVLDIDSPGGTVAGVTELAAEIRDARGGAKPIVAVANAFAASAAYWLASQADELVATPSAQVGSIGVYAVHEDVSRMLDEMGVTVTLVSAGEHKTEGNMFEPLSPEAKADIQERVDTTYKTFLADVAAGRRVPVGQVSADYGGGRVFPAKKALTAGMVDRVETLGATVQRLGRAGGQRRAMGQGNAAASARPAATRQSALRASVTPDHITPTRDGPYDAAAEVAKLADDAGEETYEQMYAWADDAGDPSSQESYLLPHHFVIGDQPAEASVAGCGSAIATLNDGSSGVPDADRDEVHDHLMAHLLYDAGEDSDADDMETARVPFATRMAMVSQQATALVAHATERARLRGKEGRPAFSTTTERSLRSIRGAIDSLLESVEPAASSAPAVPVEPAPVAPTTPPPAAPIPVRFASRDAWLHYLESHQ